MSKDKTEQISQLVCARCRDSIKGPTASICNTCNESLWVTGIVSLIGGGGGGSFIREDKENYGVLK